MVSIPLLCLQHVLHPARLVHPDSRNLNGTSEICAGHKENDRYTHSRICLRVEIFLTSCQYKATIDNSAQFLIEVGISNTKTFSKG